MAYIGSSLGTNSVGQITSEDTFTASSPSNLNGYTLTSDVTRESDIIVSINGVVQTNDAFSLSGRVLTFTSNMVAGDVVRVVHMGFRPTTHQPAANSIDGTHLQIGTPAAGDVMYYNGTDYVRLAKGTAAQVLTMNGGATAPSWADAAEGGGPALGVGGVDTVIRTNKKTITENLTFAGTENGMSAGPVTVADGYTVTVANGSVWTIV